MLLSKLYRQMYAGTGISTDSARRKKSKRTARFMAAQARKLFKAAPMPALPSPQWEAGYVAPGRGLLTPTPPGSNSAFQVLR